MKQCTNKILFYNFNLFFNIESSVPNCTILADPPYMPWTIKSAEEHRLFYNRSMSQSRGQVVDLSIRC